MATKKKSTTSTKKNTTSTKKGAPKPEAVDCKLAKANKADVDKLKKDVKGLRGDVKKAQGGDTKDLEQRLVRIEDRLDLLVKTLYNDFRGSMIKGPEGLARKLREKGLV